MTAPIYTVDNLVTLTRNSFPSPQSLSLYQDTDIISLLDNELRADIIPVINSCDADYWITNYNQAVTGATSYTVPQRSTAGSLYDVVLLDANSNPIELQELSTVQIKASFPGGFQLPLYTFGYYIEDDQLFLYPQQAVNSTGFTLQMKFFRRPNNLTSVENCGKITLIASNVLTLDYIDPTWTTSTTFDIIQNFPQFKSISDGATITAIGATSITLTTLPTGIAVGMYACPTLMTCIPQIPYEAYPLLVQRAVLKIAEGLGDSQGAGLAEKRYEDMKKKLVNMLTPRVKKATKKIRNRNLQNLYGVFGSPFLR